ncbi:MAG: hypothetical protein AB7P08_06220 [Burkholderiales bacterium]
MEHIESYTTVQREDKRINAIVAVMRGSAPASMSDGVLQARAKQVLVLYDRLIGKPEAEEREAA